MTEAILLEMENICKRFPGILALDHVNLELRSGEVHGMVGENGAGKTTLMNVLGGVVLPDSGAVHLRGREVSISRPTKALELGIAFIHQELSLFPDLDIASNLFITNLPQAGLGIVRDDKMREQARMILNRVGLSHLNPAQRVRSLSPGEQQLVEIGRCLIQRAEILVLDEPTSSLTARETQTLFTIIRELKGQGVSILYVSHRLDEVFTICDRVTVLRDGRRVETVMIADIDRSTLVCMIIGRQGDEYYQRQQRQTGAPLLEAENLCRSSKLRGISFELREGEVLGIAGLLGAGRTELARVLFGLDHLETGQIHIEGQAVTIRNTEDAIRYGIGFITENRREEGLILEKPIRDNIVLASLPKFVGRFGWMQPEKELAAAQAQKATLAIAAPSVIRLAKYLSGGNQQKVVIGKWLQTEPRIYILDEPTRGVDVGAKAEIHRIIEMLAQRGAGIILISSEVPEVINLSDRVLVMRNGQIVAHFDRAECTAANVMLAATGGLA